MSKSFAIALGAAAAVVAVLIWVAFASTKGLHLAPKGAIGKVRTVKVDENATLAILDFNIVNDSDRDMLVHSIEANLTEADGSSVPGNVVSPDDDEKAFRVYKILGEQYNPVLKERAIVPARQSVDRMIGILFNAPEEDVENRKKLDVRIEDATGIAFSLTK
jgi:hypothetical protein